MLSHSFCIIAQVWKLSRGYLIFLREFLAYRLWGRYKDTNENRVGSRAHDFSKVESMANYDGALIGQEKIGCISANVVL